MSEERRAAAERSLAEVAHALRADGYQLVVDDARERLSVRILDLPDACADCLSPPSVMAWLMAAALDGAYSTDEIDLAYPAGAE